MLIRRPEDIGALVRDQRKRLALSQAQLAEKVGTSQRYISHLESGKRTLQIGLVLRVLDVIGIALTISSLSNKKVDQPFSKRSKSARTEMLPRISIDELVDGEGT